MSDLDVIKELEKQLGCPLKQLRPEEIYKEEKQKFARDGIKRGYSLNKHGHVSSLRLDYAPGMIYDLTLVTKFTELVNLNLKGWGYNFSTLAVLDKVKRLSLSDNQIHDISFLKELKGLVSLDISFNEISDSSILKELKGLVSLDLSSNKISDYSFLKEFKGLTSLYLSSNEISDSSFLKELKGLSKLDLNFNQISDTSFLMEMEGLTSLYLSSNQIRDTYFLKGLKGLSKLYLSYNKISDTSFLEGLKGLVALDLSYNKINDISFFKELKNLRSINLRNNQISDISFLKELKKLKELYLSDNNLRDVEVLKELKQLNYVDLDNNPIVNPPQTIVENGITAIRDYFEALIIGQEKYLFEAKLLILGQPGAGKTTLARKLKDVGSELPKPEDTTWGIDVEPLEFAVDKKNIPKIANNEYLNKDITFRMNVWDFAGQDIYHATHRFFLSQRSLYVLVSDERKEDTDFKYWLQMVEKFGKDSPLIIIQNQKEEKTRELDINGLKANFNNIKAILPVNFAKIDERFTSLKNEIEYRICNLPQIGEPVPEKWKNVREDLEEIDENYITKSKYLGICNKHDITKKSTQDVISVYFHEIGVFLHFQDDLVLRNTVFLKPEWVTKAVYTIVESDVAKIEKNGRLTASDLDGIWQNEGYCDKFIDLVQLMKNFQLIYETDEGNEYVMPQLLKTNRPEYKWDNHDNRVIKYDYKKFMPKGILWQLIVKLSYYIEDDNLVWKQGVILEKAGNRAEVIENYERGYITVTVSGKQKRDLMTIVTVEVDKLNDKMNIKEVDKLIPCNCNVCENNKGPHHFAYAKLVSRLENNRKDIECDLPPYNVVDIRGLLDDYIIQENTSERKYFTEQRIHALERQLKDLYQLLHEYENILMLEDDPKKTMMIKKEITSIKQRIEYIKKEMMTISEKDLVYKGEGTRERQTLDDFSQQFEQVMDKFASVQKRLDDAK